MSHSAIHPKGGHEKRFLTTIEGWEKRDKSSPKKQKRGKKKAPPHPAKKKQKTKIYEVFMSMNYHSFSLWSPASRSEVWLHVTVAESAGLSWWIQPATSVVLQHMCTLLYAQKYMNIEAQRSVQASGYEHMHDPNTVVRRTHTLRQG